MKLQMKLLGWFGRPDGKRKEKTIPRASKASQRVWDGGDAFGHDYPEDESRHNGERNHGGGRQRETGSGAGGKEDFTPISDSESCEIVNEDGCYGKCDSIS